MVVLFDTFLVCTGTPPAKAQGMGEGDTRGEREREKFIDRGTASLEGTQTLEMCTSVIRATLCDSTLARMRASSACSWTSPCSSLFRASLTSP